MSLTIQKRLLLLLLIFSNTLMEASPTTHHKEISYCFRLYLKDKGETDLDKAAVEGFTLSKASLEKREKRGVDLAASDLPISSYYLETITAEGVQIVTKSKWMSTVVIESSDSLIVERLKTLHMIDSICCVWRGTERLKSTECVDSTTFFASKDTPLSQPYGYAQRQIDYLNGSPLHELGKRGQGMRVAVIDAGFLHVDRIQAFESLNLLGSYNAISPGTSVFCEDAHGTKVLSCMASNLPGVMVGTAPQASYLLIKSEDMHSEHHIEEDYWASAVEYADSVGVDVITSSLGYSLFDLSETPYTTDDLNGKTAFISQVAEKIAEKGMLLFCSVGNEGKKSWQRITFPSDVDGIISVGATTTEGVKSAFSSSGFTSDYRIKPDVSTLGTDVCVINGTGEMQYVDGTSFSTPTLAGLVTCLWQALTWLSNKEMIELIRETASQANRPDVELGYGIPDLYKAYKKELNEPIEP